MGALGYTIATGLDLAWLKVKGIRKIKIETYSCSAIKLIKNGCAGNHPCHAVIWLIKIGPC